MNFNKQVLAQVAKDGIVYKSLAKEMATALLNEKNSSVPIAMRIILSSSREETKMFEEQSINANPPIPIYEFAVLYLKAPDGDVYPVYNLVLRTP